MEIKDFDNWVQATVYLKELFADYADQHPKLFAKINRYNLSEGEKKIVFKTNGFVWKEGEKRKMFLMIN